MQFKISVLLSSLFACTVAASAQASDSAKQSQFGFAAQLDAEFGGDDLVEVTFTNGHSQTMHAGQGLGQNAGVHFRPENSKFDFVGTIGYKFVPTAASDADIRLVRVPVKLQAYYDVSQLLQCS